MQKPLAHRKGCPALHSRPIPLYTALTICRELSNRLKGTPPVSEVERVLPVQNRLGEGPRWNVDEQALYWVDIENDAFHRFDPATGAQERCVVGLPVGALGFRGA